MRAIRPVGREAGAKKYDILSALMAHGLAGDSNLQRITLRLLSLITTRYNWQRNELVIGQREIARLWCVDERTVKREMAKLRLSGWIIVKRQGSRGRVSVLGLDIQRIMLDSQSSWPNIGDDYVARMSNSEDNYAIKTTNVVIFPSDNSNITNNTWKGICAFLHEEDSTIFNSWFAQLNISHEEDNILYLTAPSRFHANYIRTHLLTRLEIASRRTSSSGCEIRISP
jgi:hypothetical protein